MGSLKVGHQFTKGEFVQYIYRDEASPRKSEKRVVEFPDYLEYHIFLRDMLLPF